MNLKAFVKKSTLTSALLLASHMVAAQAFTCPTLAELKQFGGFSIEYPLSLDVQSQEPNSWLAAKIDVNTKGVVNTLVFSPIKTQEDEEPIDVATNMIDSLVLYEGKTDDEKFPQCDDDMIENAKICACVYWIPADGTLASYVHAKYRRHSQPNPVDNIKVAAIAMRQLQHLPNLG